jgi:hypothetical protein
VGVVLEITPGTGKTPTIDSPCDCHYAGTLTDGTEFDSSYKRGAPLTFAPNQVIKVRRVVACSQKLLTRCVDEVWNLGTNVFLSNNQTGMDGSDAVDERG